MTQGQKEQEHDWHRAHSYLNGWTDRMAHLPERPAEGEFDAEAYQRGYAAAEQYVDTHLSTAARARA